MLGAELINGGAGYSADAEGACADGGVARRRSFVTVTICALATGPEKRRAAAHHDRNVIHRISTT
jgi:hypothetical protein